MKIHFGPNLSRQVTTILQYASTLDPSINDTILSSYNEDDNTLVTFMNFGKYYIDNITIYLENGLIVHPTDMSMIREIYGYFEADTTEILQEFFKNANEYINDLINNGKVNNKIKILAFDYKWDCDMMINKKKFSSIHLPLKTMTDFRKDIDNFVSNETRQKYEHLEIIHSRIYALHGPPGTGKTTLIHTIASQLNLNIGIITFDNTMNDRTFKMALKKIPNSTILCLEDIDCLFCERKSTESYVTFSGVINAIDGICKLKNIIIFLTTNHLERLDPALKRRIDYFIKFDFSKKEQVEEMFTRFLPNEDFNKFWKVCSKLKVTTSILQKFFICNMHKQFDEYYTDIKDFVDSEYGLEKLPDMYT